MSLAFTVDLPLIMFRLVVCVHPTLNLLSVPSVRTCFGSRSFAVAAPTIWNILHLDIRNCRSRRHLKTFFTTWFSGLLSPPMCFRLGGVFWLKLCAIQIHLLTYLLYIRCWQRVSVQLMAQCCHVSC